MCWAEAICGLALLVAGGGAVLARCRGAILRAYLRTVDAMPLEEPADHVVPTYPMS